MSDYLSNLIVRGGSLNLTNAPRPSEPLALNSLQDRDATLTSLNEIDQVEQILGEIRDPHELDIRQSDSGLLLSLELDSTQTTALSTDLDEPHKPKRSSIESPQTMHPAPQVPQLPSTTVDSTRSKSFEHWTREINLTSSRESEGDRLFIPTVTTIHQSNLRKDGERDTGQLSRPPRTPDSPDDNFRLGHIPKISEPLSQRTAVSPGLDEELVRIHIGTIEIRASSSAPTSTSREPSRKARTLTLEEYLKKHREARR